jgi:hypothetical protein
MERALFVSLPALAVGARRTEREIYAQLEAELPLILGGLYDIVSGALRREPTVIPPTNIRMADAAAWLKAAEPGTGLAEGAILAAIEESQVNSVVDRISEHPVVVAIEKQIANDPFRGRVSELHAAIYDDRHKGSLPKTAQHLSNALARLKPAMAKIGISVELESRTREGRWVSIWKQGQNPNAPPRDWPRY